MHVKVGPSRLPCIGSSAYKINELHLINNITRYIGKQKWYKTY